MPKLKSDKPKTGLVAKLVKKGTSALSSMITKENLLSVGNLVKDMIISPSSHNRATNVRVPALNLLGTNHARSSTNLAPAAFATTTSDSTHIRLEGHALHKSGAKGIVITGQQPFTICTTAAATVALFTSASLANVSSNYCYITPDQFNGPMATQASAYGRYRFTDIWLEYTTSVATSIAGTICLAVVPSGLLANLPVTYMQARVVTPSVSFPQWSPKAVLHKHWDDPDEPLRLTYTDTSTTADKQITTQGYIVGLPIGVGGTVYVTGQIQLKYRLELYDPVPTLAIVLNLRDEQEATFMRRLLKYYRDLNAQYELEHKDDFVHVDTPTGYAYPDITKVDNIGNFLFNEMKTSIIARDRCNKKYQLPYPATDVNLKSIYGTEDATLDVLVTNISPIPVIVEVPADKDKPVVSSTVTTDKPSSWFGK